MAENFITVLLVSISFQLFRMWLWVTPMIWIDEQKQVVMGVPKNGCVHKYLWETRHSGWDLMTWNITYMVTVRAANWHWWLAQCSSTLYMCTYLALLIININRKKTYRSRAEGNVSSCRYFSRVSSCVEFLILTLRDHTVSRKMYVKLLLCLYNFPRCVNIDMPLWLG